MAYMEDDTRTAISLTGWKRPTIGILGILLIALSIAAYIDQRASVLGDSTSDLSGFNIVYAILAGMGGIFTLSAAIGYWVMWKDVSLLDPGKPDVKNVETVKASPEGGANTRTTSTPPFDGNFVEVPLDEADPDFVKVAKDVFYGNSESGDNFTAAVQSVFRSTPGRPSWYFLLNTSDGRSSWLKVPHAGRRGAGAGVPGK